MNKFQNFISSLISKSNNLSQKHNNTDSEILFFDKKSTFDYVEPLTTPTTNEFETLKESIKNRNKTSIEYFCVNPRTNIVYDTRYIDTNENFGIIYPYDVFDTNRLLFDGYRSKNFFICRTKNLFNELYDELQQNPNCSYFTHANDSILNGDRPNSLSVLYMATNNSTPMDEFASKLLNFYEVPTAYYKTIAVYDNQNEKYAIQNISVDFIKPDFEFASLEDCYDENKNNFKYTLSSIQKQVGIFNNKLPLSNKMSLTEKEYNKTKLRKQFIESYICRSLLMSDNDYDLHNIGILTNRKTKEITLAPNFDLEFCFTANPIKQDHNIRTTFPYFEKHYPKILQKLLDKTESLLQKDNFNNCPLYSIIDSCLSSYILDKQKIEQTISFNLSVAKDSLSPNFNKDDDTLENTK